MSSRLTGMLSAAIVGAIAALAGVGVARSECWAYVNWYHDLSTKDWATWFPGAPVQPGSVGAFNRDLCFDHNGETLKDHGISCARLSGETSMPPLFSSTTGGFEFEPKGAASAVPGFAALGEASASVRLTTTTEHACLIQMLNPTERRIANPVQVQEAILARLRSGHWSVDLQVVMRRTRCTSGFAAVSRAARQSAEFKAGARLPAVITDQNLPDLELRLGSGRSSSGFLVFPFIETSTPAFGGVVRVRRDLWPRLLPWRADGPYLVDPRGKRFLPASLPAELSAYAPADRCYSSARSVMSPAELSALTAEDVFEEVTTLPGQDGLSDEDSPGLAGLAVVKSFPLPRSAVPSTLAAADDEEAPVLLDAVFEDGLAQFTVYDRGSDRYWLEVTLRHTGPQPSVAALRYQARDGALRDLIVPVADDGAAAGSSIVDLPGYQPGTDGRAALAAAVGGQPWPAETVRRSVLAVVGNATARAWEQLAALVPAETGEVIERALRDLRGTT
jgi:hypothetical protein